MIVWLNGPFGVGKTTTGKLIAETTGWGTGRTREAVAQEVVAAASLRRR